MKRVWWSLSLLALMSCALALVFMTHARNTASTTPVALKMSSKTHGSPLVEVTETKTTITTKTDSNKMASDVHRAKLGRDADGDLPPALQRRLEKLKRAMPGNEGEGPAASAAEWRFRAQAYPETDISLDKIE